VLSDEEKREKYDRYGHAAFDPAAGAGGGGGFGGFGSNFGGSFDFEDIFSSFFGGGSRGGTNNARRANMPEDGDDLLARITVSFEEAANGCKKEVNYARVESCPDCNGSGSEPGTKPETCQNCRGRGFVTVQQQTLFGYSQTQRPCPSCRGTGKIIKNPCGNCRGTGYIKVTKKLSVNIPAGIDDGERIALRGQGCDGRNGGPAGDLIITVSVRKHAIFTRRANNIYCDIPITVAEATLGAEIDVPTLEGNQKYNIPEGTQPGTQFTLKQKGIPYVHSSSRRGDLVFTVSVEIPRSLSEKQKEHMRAFAESCKESNYSKKNGFFKRIFDKK
jgi:molecular chaperone DnaJ